MIEINARSVQEAGKDVLRAITAFRMGLHKTAASQIESARIRLHDEAIWRGDGWEDVQRYLNFVLAIQTNLLKLSDIDLSIPASMVYFGRKDTESLVADLEKSIGLLVEASA